MIEIPVDLGERTYRVVVGAGARHELADMVASAVPAARRAAIVTQAGIGASVDPGLPVDEFIVPDGEGAKSLTVVEELCRGFARAGLSRSDVIIAVGGGVVTDLAGFAAAVVPPGDRLRQRGHHAAGPGRRGHRGQDRGQPPRGKEPGRRLLAAERA